MKLSSSAIVTVAFGHSTEHLDHTFISFAINQEIPLHAFIIGRTLPERRLPQVKYHLIEPVPDFSHPLREVYFRRMQLLDELDVNYALVVDSYDVLCLQPLPPFEKILAGGDVAACVEHEGGRYILGQGYTSNFLNAGVCFWNVPASRDIRREIVTRGRSHFRTIADDQFCLNEILQTQYFDRIRILPCQYNYRAYFKKKKRHWPTVEHLDGVMIYHNADCMAEAKKNLTVKPRASLPPLPIDSCPLTRRQQLLRRLRNRFKPWIVS